MTRFVGSLHRRHHSRSHKSDMRIVPPVRVQPMMIMMITFIINTRLIILLKVLLLLVAEPSKWIPRHCLYKNPNSVSIDEC
jgi:hypothetical protein